MNCEETRHLLLSSLDAPVVRQSDALLQAHLGECEACRRFDTLHRQLDARLADALPVLPLSAEFRSALREKLPRHSAQERWSDSLPDIAHLAGCALATLCLLALIPRHSSAVLAAAVGFTTITFFLQAVLRSFLQSPEV